MTDRRLVAANGRVAAIGLAGQGKADKYVTGWPMSVCRPVVDLRRAPDGARDRQVLLGACVTVFEDREGWSFVQIANGYVGYIRSADLGAFQDATHFVGTMATHAYSSDDFRSEPRHGLPFGARVRVVDERRHFYETTVGFIPKKHLRGLDRPYQDPINVAQLHFGVPYLWGGNSVRGIDCSGLVQVAHLACGITCPGDSDQQELTFGWYLDDAEELRRGDIVFWKGHVALVVENDTIIHANAHHMAVAYESLEQAIRRIEAQGDGLVTARKRLQRKEG